MAGSHHVEVLILGAGLSGIGVACHLEKEGTGRSYVVLERREAIGGTWDLFRYPGIRSDSDMLTFGYGFRPWIGSNVLSDGAGIRQYVTDTAAEYGVTPHIRFGRKATRANWNSVAQLWEVDAEYNGKVEHYTADVVVNASGYYNYDQGFQPEFAGLDDFEGQVIHPQFWPEGLDYAGKNVVVIGSGATAITLIPAMADAAGHITMLQRSPTYIMAVPASDPVAGIAEALKLPAKLFYGAGRKRNIALLQAIYKFCRKYPKVSRKLLLGAVKVQLGGKVDMKHFTPSYMPWDERLCVVPNGDLFTYLRKGKAEIVTDHIDTFTPTGIRTKSGLEIPADIVITATGLQIQIGGGATFTMDGVPVPIHDKMLYRGVLMEDVPNFAHIVGYTNASWTLKADLASEYICRVLNHIKEHGHSTFVPVDEHDQADVTSMMGDSMRSGYIARGNAVMPRQGKHTPWRIYNDYAKDIKLLRKQPIDDGVLRFDDAAAVALAADAV